MKKLFPYFLLLFLAAPFLGYGLDNPGGVEERELENIYSINIDGVITNGVADYVEAAIKTASDNGGVVLIKLDTPGGVLEATRAIVSHMFSSPVPVTVYVAPGGARAASAGVFITLAADYAVMDKGTNIGAAHPVNSAGQDIEGEMGKKVTNDTVAFIRSIAQKRGRNIEAAEKMVTESVSFTAEEALKNNIIDAVPREGESVGSMIIEKFHMAEGSEIMPVERTFLQSVANVLSNPDFLAAMLFLGLIMIGLEFKMPGSFIFAGSGIAFLILFAIGANIIPVNYLAFFLILGGFALLIAEIFVTSFGLLAVGGILCLLFGLRMLFDRSESMGVGVSLWLTILVVGIAAAIALIIGRLVVRDFKKRPASGMETMLGKKAKVIDWQGNEGRVAIYGEIWNAQSVDKLEPDDEVKITSYGDMTLRVKKD